MSCPGRSAAVIIAAWTAGAACGAAAFGQELAGSSDVREMILRPLADEFAVERGAARNVRFTPEPVVAPADAAGDAGASRFARAALSARSAPGLRENLSVFTERSATLTELADGGRISVSVLDGRRPNAALLAFNADYAESVGFPLQGLRDRPRQMAVSYERSIDAPGALDGLDLGVQPRAGVSFGAVGTAANAGATVRIGQYVSEMSERPRWWLFAGADREALLYDPSAGFTLRRSFAFEPYAMVGDAQAGVAMKFGPADLSLAYVQRETTYSTPVRSWDTTEDFAAFSLTLRR
ncbi:hypothetical protein DDZ18_13420 [Marinicauda salina]|uniref:DUF2219 family protein n=1 Tax=Marinicauda salina TaxID=2135793 RepID=A0A2U2BQX7_9PROT|nr:lipid A-modifier LpxR family protein [Marinicauda salina]PWE16414.1 hypothetical protein DDZ18_13420 [Marinicauda salina]